MTPSSTTCSALTWRRASKSAPCSSTSFDPTRAFFAALGNQERTRLQTLLNFPTWLPGIFWMLLNMRQRDFIRMLFSFRLQWDMFGGRTAGGLFLVKPSGEVGYMRAEHNPGDVADWDVLTSEIGKL